MTVFYRDVPVGYLHPDGRGGFLFSYAEEWMQDANAFPISVSLPVAKPVDPDRGDAFFSNLLPEGPNKENLCRQLGISPDNNYELLRAIGRDCAGALVIGEAPEQSDEPSYEEFGAGELSALIRSRPALPLFDDGEYVRFSLAGSASKWALVFRDGRFFWPRGSAVSTHILKVYDPRFSHGPRNEAFTGFLAAKLGLSVALSTPTDDYLLIERYDRTGGDRTRGDRTGGHERIHQEDTAQALGIPPFMKYQREGGAGLAQVIDLIREYSRQPLQDQHSVITWQLANLILGNADGHLKNISLLYDGHRVRLAPFYDMVCARNYDGVERKLALRIGDADDPGHIGRAQLRGFARETRIAEKYILTELLRIMDQLDAHLDDYAHEFTARWGDSPVIDRIGRIVRDQIRRTRTLVR